MAKIEFPKPLEELLQDSELLAPVRLLADKVGTILADNKLAFFPDYTDHGADHVNRVLKTEMELVTKEVWDERLLSDADAAVIIGSTLLHDIAMHLQPQGFLELVSNESRFQPLSWFREDHDGYKADVPWNELWHDYVREARRLSDRDLTNILGEESARVWKFHELPEDTGQWEKNHFRIVGEFIRRHHARLAHEIAIYGFPGLRVGSNDGQFPAMGKEEGHLLRRLADLIGLTARSHGMSLRVCKAYLDSSPDHLGTPRPMGVAVLYPMALLRVADYLQIDGTRAPAVLLKLHAPQSPVSVQEWQKHRAVQQIGPASDPRGRMVTVSTDLTLTLFLQIQDLLCSLQTEMDHSTAVLDEVYGPRTDLGLHKLTLSIRRVYSNLQSPAFRASLPYIPNATGFTADPNLLTLLVEPLYGKEPGVGVRELMQNAVDAVRELDAWCEIHGKDVSSLDMPEQDSDVLIEFIQRENNSWFLRVRDKGVGMTSDTIQNYFLRAGASFRCSSEWAKEFLDEKGKPQVTRAGRFGIGVFALFLLGPTFRLWTRHVGSKHSNGYEITASSNSQLIEIRRVQNLPVGTMIEVDLNADTVETFNSFNDNSSSFLGSYRLTRRIDWYCWDWPKIQKRIASKERVQEIPQQYVCPTRNLSSSPEWSEIRSKDFDAVYWTFGDAPQLSCNGLKIQFPSFEFKGVYRELAFEWLEEIGLKAPCIAVRDNAANLALTAQRYELSDKRLPFAGELVRDVILSFIANALVCGPESPDDAIRDQHAFPLAFENCTKLEDNDLAISSSKLSWCFTSTGFVAADCWLYSLLNVTSCIAIGSIAEERIKFEQATIRDIMDKVQCLDSAIFVDHNSISHIEDNDKLLDLSDDVSILSEQLLDEISFNGVPDLGHSVENSSIIVSSDLCFSYCLAGFSKVDSVPEDDKSIWYKLEPNIDNRYYFKASTGEDSSYTLLADLLFGIENSILANHNPERHRYRPAISGILYVAEIHTERSKYTPGSILASIWNECLGPRIIPFDPTAREALITEACKHAELKRHIEAWQEMKRTGSKYVSVPEATCVDTDLV